MKAIAVMWSMLFAVHCVAAQAQERTLVVTSTDNIATIFAVDPLTGNREIISQTGGRGDGYEFMRASSIALDSFGDFLVTDTFIDEGLYQVDHQTGDRTLISGGFFTKETRGSGPLDNISTVLTTPTNDILLINQGGFHFSTGFITKVNPLTGNRTLVSGLGVGTGPTFARLAGGVLDPSGNLLVPDYSQSTIFKVNLANGTRQVLSGPSRGTGPSLAQIWDLTFTPDGSLYAIGDSTSPTFVNRLFRIDPVSGNRTVISTLPGLASEGYGYRLIADDDGTLLSSAPGVVNRINPTNGSLTLVSGNGVGSGYPLYWGDLLMYPGVIIVPEPSSLFLGCAGLLAVPGYRLAGRRRYLRAA